MTCVLRRASIADAAVLAELHRQCFAEAWDETSFATLLDEANTFGLLAKMPEASGFESFIIARVAADEGEILAFGTLPRVRRRGLAHQLLEQAVSEVRRRGGLRIFLEVAEDNAAALALYSSSGFSRAGTRRGYYSRSSNLAVTALVLRRDLSTLSGK